MHLTHMLTAGLIPALAMAQDAPSTTLRAQARATTTKPSPIMPGVVDNCDGFYKVTSQDGCDTIARKNGISVAQFKSWNREINDSMCFPCPFSRDLRP